jgi:hypothetical protein
MTRPAYTSSESTALATAADALRLAADALDAAAAASGRAEREDTALPAGLVSVGRAARVLGVSRTALYGAMARGEVPSRKIGGRRLVPGDWLTRMGREADDGAGQRDRAS